MEICLDRHRLWILWRKVKIRASWIAVCGVYQWFPITVPRHIIVPWEIIKWSVENYPISLNWSEICYFRTANCLSSLPSDDWRNEWDFLQILWGYYCVGNWMIFGQAEFSVVKYVPWLREGWETLLSSFSMRCTSVWLLTYLGRESFLEYFVSSLYQ